ncbi:MAG: methyltransferase domain-containing protein [Hyphomicrobiaceae bacterium]
MKGPELLFDRRLQRQWLHRHQASIDKGDFLRAWVADDLASRLLLVHRQLGCALVIGAGARAIAPALVSTGKILEAVLCEPVAPAAVPAGRLVVGDSEALPFAEHSFNLAVSLLELHQINDLPGALVELRRVLKPDGLLLATMIGGQSLQELARAFAAGESELRGGASPRVAPMVDVRDLGGLVQRAGFALPVVDVDPLNLTYASVGALMRELRQLGCANALNARSRRHLTKRLLAAVASAYEREVPAQDGRVTATIEILTVTAWSPGPGQPQPLKPGSAQVRLGDALGRRDRT